MKSKHEAESAEVASKLQSALLLVEEKEGVIADLRDTVQSGKDRLVQKGAEMEAALVE